MNRAGREASWGRIRRSWLAPAAPAPLRVGVAGPDRPEPVLRLSEALREESGRQGLDAMVEVLDLGAVDERGLARLDRERPRCDHLIWALPSTRPFSLRSVYLLGVYRWALGGVPLSCLLEEEAPATGLEEGMGRARRAGVLRAPADVLRWQVPNRGLGGLLQAILARADAARRAVGAVILLLAVLSPVAAAAQGNVEVEIHGLEGVDRQELRGGGRVLSDPDLSLVVDGGLPVEESSGGVLRFRVPRSQLRVRLAEGELSWEPGDYHLEQPLRLRAPGVDLILRRGWVEVGPERLRLATGRRGGLGRNSSGWLTSIILLAGLFLLFWSGARMRRRLHESGGEGSRKG